MNGYSFTRSDRKTGREWRNWNVCTIQREDLGYELVVKSVIYKF